MKTRLLLVLMTLATITFTCCDTNDDNASQTESLNGTWNLKNVKGGLIGIDEDFESGIITWTFNNQNGTLYIEDNNQQATIYSGYATGTYPFAVVQSNGSTYLYINNTEVGRYTFASGNLTINENEIQFGSGADGFILKFEH